MWKERIDETGDMRPRLVQTLFSSLEYDDLSSHVISCTYVIVLLSDTCCLSVLAISFFSATRYTSLVPANLLITRYFCLPHLLRYVKSMCNLHRYLYIRSLHPSFPPAWFQTLSLTSMSYIFFWISFLQKQYHHTTLAVGVSISCLSRRHLPFSLLPRRPWRWSTPPQC